ncbi:hypothetical protein AXF42_Ash018061 [Apostasia shenzhenica]|uniref:Uncharacterized protein n=1 Tax=Apostasia shenzhenica TaxID=1088818 RepID=A0A2I0AVL7_9ASPA|nr:hypothetical protein AXF42_Ash018061 [Apostasia shenzhenica]
MLDLWPTLRIEGWEIDETLIYMAREFFGLSNLENLTRAGGSLNIHVGDALSPAASVRGGFAGIIVDLFSNGKILPQLREAATWLEMEEKLMPNGRVMVNCGGMHAEISDSGYIKINRKNSFNGQWVQNSTIRAMCRAFPDKLNWKRMDGNDSENYLALTGPEPDLDAWSAALPAPLNMNVRHWKPCQPAW